MVAVSNVYLNFKIGDENSQRMYNNFIQHIIHFFGPQKATHDLIKQYILENYNGVYVLQISKRNYLQKHYIRFSDPKDMTAFILRFG